MTSAFAPPVFPVGLDVLCRALYVDGDGELPKTSRTLVDTTPTLELHYRLCLTAHPRPTEPALRRARRYELA